MKLLFLGHASIQITSARGTSLVMDPYESGYKGMIQYGPISEPADVVTISHEHGDHNCTEGLGTPTIVRGDGRWDVDDFRITGIRTFHDSVSGKQRGENTVFLVEVDGLRICHLGDLGHLLGAEQEKLLDRLDILLIPVGGNYTLPTEDAAVEARRLGARVLVPMHYKTDKVGFDLRPLEDFLALISDVEHVRKNVLLSEDLSSFQEPKIVVLDPIH